jgi:adsorption protein B
MGDWKFRFSLYRDRKAVVSNLMTMLAYLVVVLYLTLELIRWSLSPQQLLGAVITSQSLLWYIVMATSFMMISRAVHRAYFVSRIYGAIAGLLSIIRLPVLNFVNFLAAIRALKLYITAEQKKQPLKWEKTEHKFLTPSGMVHTKGISRTTPIIPKKQTKG